MSKQTKRNSDFLQSKSIREAAARSMIAPDWASEAPVVERPEEPAQVATEVVAGWCVVLMEVDGSSLLVNVATLEQRWVSLEELQTMRDAAQADTKVERLAENLKHLDKSGRHALTPHGLYGGGVVFANDVAQAAFYFRKAYQGRNKSNVKVTRGMRHQVLEALDALIYDTRPSRFFEGEAVRTPRQSQAIVDGYYHWFPVALENTTYSDAIARHFGAYFQQGLRATRGFLQDGCLYRKYQWWGWQSSAVYGNKAQVNRYRALKTS